ncbi:MAG: type VI secretion system baseplate subunit TssE [Tropicimonas sp.]|uniref:type VI secretion system baseplate subunit TssE n=1 Tax=Tropicimonas sp. TaxID=2067044 RepID=UPI003A863D25
MAERRGTSGDRLAPSLLDRLIDLDPDLERDPPVTPAEQPGGLRAALRRDLEILLNTRCRPTSPPAGHGELADSLVSLGVEDFFATSLVTDMQRQAFARTLRTRIARFEPRLENLDVELVADPAGEQRSLRLRISALYRARSGLPPIVFETRMDPVAGRFTVTEARHG